MPKRGNTSEEYEDAYAAAPQLGYFAVADGATESSYASLWAQLLVKKFIHTPPRHPEEWAEWLAPLQQYWAKRAGSTSQSWFADAKLQQGAFAAFLGLILRKTRWKAIAVGDCCLFHVRQDRLLRAFPITRSQQFSNQPELVGSRTCPAKVGDELLMQGDWKDNDQLLMMTDALSQWFLQKHESGHRPWEVMLRLADGNNGRKEFAGWVEKLRDKEGLRNDDVTLVAVSLRPGKPVNQQ